jgi:hypothetical protein
MFAVVFFAGKRAPTVDFRQLRHWRRAQRCVNRSIGVARRTCRSALAREESGAALALRADLRHPLL